MSLRLPGSRRSSMNRPLHYSSRRSSQAVHPTNLQDHRRLSAVSQIGPYSHSRSSSRKSSRCDERCLSRRSSNIQHKVAENQNAIKDASQNNLSQNIAKKENVATVTNERSKTCEKESKVNLEDIKDISKDVTNPLSPKNQNNGEQLKPSMKNLIPVKPSRGNSSSNLLQKAPGRALPRRPSYVPPAEATILSSSINILKESKKEVMQEKYLAPKSKNPKDDELSKPSAENLMLIKPSQGNRSPHLIEKAPGHSSTKRSSHVSPAIISTSSNENVVGSNPMVKQEKET